VRLAYLGTPDMAVPPLRALVERGHDVRLVVSRADRRRGRGGAMSPSPVKQAALELGLPVTDDVDEVITSGAELGVVVAFGRIIKPHVLLAVPMINVHFSLLPRWRGAAPVERAILAGDTTTGVCIMDVEEQLDTGNIHAEREVPIGPTTTADDLRAELVAIGTELLLEVLDRPVRQSRPQRGVVTYAEKLRPEELVLDWSKPALHLDRVVRVGGAWTTFRGRRLKVHAAIPEPDVTDIAPGVLGPDGASVGTAAGALRLVTVQPEGKQPMSWAAFCNGAHPQPGERLESPTAGAPTP
jgi:methionyl-tRNA formyltransferase